MGSDDLFHRRKARHGRQLKRRLRRQEPYSKVLIVCEGKKTEPNYFQELRDHYRLRATNVVITGDCGSDPMSVYKAARDRYAEHSGAGDAFDKVYCVFDQDSHATYQQALDAIARARPNGVWKAINSVPCFEYWILLHFNYTTQSFRAVGGDSGCQRVMRELRRYHSGYEKGCQGLFEQMYNQLDDALAHASRALQEARRTGNDNPMTLVHELVEELRSLRNESN